MTKRRHIVIEVIKADWDSAANKYDLNYAADSLQENLNERVGDNGTPVQVSFSVTPPVIGKDWGHGPLLCAAMIVEEEIDEKDAGE